MTLTEAKLFFPVKENEDIDELWESRLFEQKQFFLTRPPIASVFQSRIKKLDKQYKAYLTIKKEEDSIRPIDQKNQTEPFSSTILESFNDYHKRRNTFKQELLQAQDFASVKTIITSWMNMEKEYYRVWQNEESSADEIETFKSKEPDPMELLDSIKFVRQQLGIETFKQLHSMHFDLPQLMRREVKRLTLLAKD